MHVVNVSDLPAGEGTRSVSLEGTEVGGVDLSIIFVDLDPGRQLSLHLAPEMLTEWLEGTP